MKTYLVYVILESFNLLLVLFFCVIWLSVCYDELVEAYLENSNSSMAISNVYKIPNMVKLTK